MTYRTLLVGCGSISIQELKGLTARADVEVVGLVDLKEENARARASEFGLDRAEISSDLAGALKRLDPDVVVDCTVPSAHASVVIPALEHGCHVLGQKPMADTLENARAMVKAASKAKGTYGLIQTSRHSAGPLALREFLASGRIGEVHTLDLRFFAGMHFENDFRLTMEHSLLLDMAIHAFDLSRFISGKDAMSVYAQDWNPPGSWFGHGASAAAIFRMTDGARFVYHGSWCAEGVGGNDWRVIGSEGSAVLKGSSIQAHRAKWRPGNFKAELEDISTEVAPLAKEASGHVGAVNDFFDALNEGREPIAPPEDNIKSLAMVLAAFKSAEEGREVEIEA